VPEQPPQRTADVLRRAGCGGTRTSGSEGGGEQTTARKRGTTARPRPYHLGIARSPAFHYEPETNGCAEKAIQTLKEQLLWIDRYDTLDELRTAVRQFGRTYNQHRLIERHDNRTPTEARDHLHAQAAATA